MNEHQVMAGVAIVLVLAVALWISLRGLRRAEALAQRQAAIESELAAARDAIRQAEAAVEAAGAQAKTLERRLEDMSEQLEQLRLRDDSSSGYGHAIKLAQRGAGVEQLVRDCGLNRGEAELVISLHGRSAGE